MNKRRKDLCKMIGTVKALRNFNEIKGEVYKFNISVTDNAFEELQEMLEELLKEEREIDSFTFPRE